MEKASKALHWIVGILQVQQIPFQIAGGLAAKVYGSTRELDDIDIDIPEESFALIQPFVQSYVIFGPQQFNDENWQIYLMTLDYDGQKIDLGGAYKTKIFNQQGQHWEDLACDLSRAKPSMIFGMEVPVIPLKELTAYKTKLARKVDMMDVQEIMAKIKGYACKR